MTSNPFMVGGPDSFDTQIMEHADGHILCKGGAEGYQALGIMPGVLRAGSPGLGIIIKISDGDLSAHTSPRAKIQAHARPAVALEMLRQLGVPLHRRKCRPWLLTVQACPSIIGVTLKLGAALHCSLCPETDNESDTVDDRLSMTLASVL